MMIADRVLELSQQQHFFVGGIAVYGVTTLYMLQQQVLRRLSARVRKVIAVVMAESPLALLIVFFCFGPTTWPTSMFPYLAATLVIAPIMIVLTERLFRRRR